MRSAFWSLVFAFALILPFTYQAHALSDAEAAFAKLKSLKGVWTGAAGTETFRVEFEVHSNGHSVVEKFEGMVTVYALDGDSILMTHYCSIGNEPRLRASKFDPQLSSLDFEFVDIANLKPGVMHIAGLKLAFNADGSISETWTDQAADGKTEQFKMDLSRSTP